MIFGTFLSMALLSGMTVTSGCAAHGHATGPISAGRVPFGYTDREHLFAVQLRDAHSTSRGPSSGVHGMAARLGGNVCGTDIAFDAENWGQFMSLTGFVTNSHSKGDGMGIVVLTPHMTSCGDKKNFSGYVPGEGDSRPVRLEVRDVVEAGHSSRRVTGSVGDVEGMALLSKIASNVPAHEVDLRFNREQLSGDVGLRRYDLHREGDNLVGYFMMYGNKVPFIVHGADELWSMPAAAQAAVLPLLLTCTEETRVVQRVDFRN
jgi:hypothetical protein